MTERGGPEGLPPLLNVEYRTRNVEYRRNQEPSTKHQEPRTKNPMSYSKREMAESKRETERANGDVGERGKVGKTGRMTMQVDQKAYMNAVDMNGGPDHNGKTC